MIEFGSKLRSMHVHLRQYVLVISMLAVPLDTQPQEANLIVERLHAYLVAYEAAISTVVADEAYEQRTVRDRMLFRLAGTDGIRGIRTTRLAFEEKGAPTLIRGENDGRWVLSRGFVWIEAASGAIWRAQVFYRDYVTGHSVPASEGEVLVDFVRHAALSMLVPERMREVFHVPSGRGEGEAKYSNYRRFTTSARLIPQE